jgi:hypothetical protein
VSEQAFDVFVTCDQSLPHQQNLVEIGFGIVVLAARDNRPATLLALVPRILGLLRSLGGGEVVRISDR